MPISSSRPKSIVMPQQNFTENRLSEEGPGLLCRNLTVSYEGTAAPVIDRLSFELPAGASLAIVGASGCGKSTLLTVLAGLRKVDAGSVDWILNGKNTSLSALRSSFVWQQLGLFPWKRVKENLALPFLLDGKGLTDEHETKLAEMLDELKLTGLENRFPSELSGGQRQRLALGRALIVRPDVVFMDEPFSALDAMLRERLQDFLATLRTTHPCSVILVTHDIGEAAVLGSHILVLAANPARKLDFFENPAFSREEGRADRDHPAFYDVVKRIHAALRTGSEGVTA